MFSLDGVLYVCVEIAFAGTNSFDLDRGISNVLEDNVKLVICVHLTMILKRVSFLLGQTVRSRIKENEISNHWMTTRTDTIQQGEVHRSRTLLFYFPQYLSSFAISTNIVRSNVPRCIVVLIKNILVR